MQSVAEGATAGVDWCQTLGQVSEQMDSLLDRQRGQRILPNKSRLLTKREKKKEKEKKFSHNRVTQPHCNIKVTKLNTCIQQVYLLYMQLCPYRMYLYNSGIQHNSTSTALLSTTRRNTPHIHAQKKTPHFPSKSLPTQAIGFLSAFT